MAGKAGRYKIVLSEKAQQHIEELFNYLHDEVGSPKAAKQVVEEILRLIFDIIAYYPQGFKVFPYFNPLHKQYRQAPCITWHIVYKIEEEQVVILAVIHASRDPDSYHAFL